MSLISCIIPTFNRKELLEKAILSCIAQTYTNWEVIIVDDGSMDETEALVSEYSKKDARIKYFKNPKKGPCSARNYGIMQAAGDYIVFLDDDDEHLPHRFASQLEAMKKSGFNFILSWFMTRDLKNGKKGFPKMHIGKGNGAGHGPRWMITRDLLIKAGLFDESMPAMQEVELSYRISKYESFAYHDSIVVCGGINHDSITKSPMKMISGIELLLIKHEKEMLPLEAAWWYFVLALNYYNLDDIKNALCSLRKAAALDERGIYRVGLYLAKTLFPCGVLFKKINNRIFQKVKDFKFPTLVEHPVLK